MTQKRRETDSGKAIGETTALRWEPTHVTKPNPRVVPLHTPYSSSPTPGILPCTISGSQASCQTVDKNGNLKSFCPQACYLHLTFLL